MLQRRSVLISLVLLPAALAPTARAATVSESAIYEPGYKGSSETVTTVEVVAGAGERNILTLTMTAPQPGAYAGAVVVADAGGAPLTAGAGCTAGPDGRVTCPPQGSVMNLDVDAGDEDDSVVASGRAYTRLRGGDGDDTLDISGVDSVDTLLGGAGDDVLIGGPGSDTLDGGTGHDRMTGGAGFDTVTYRDRDDPIQATVGASQPGDEDALGDDLEVLTGGRGPDRLTGSDQRDYLDGGPGADVLDGRGGDDDLRADDTLYSESGHVRPTPAAGDTLAGGPGDDVLTLSHGGGGRADGGPGADTINGVGAATLTGGPGRDRLSLLGIGGTVIAADDGAGADQVGCTMTDTLGRHAAGPGPRTVALGPSDVSIGCKGALHRSGTAPGALAIAHPEAVDDGVSDARSSLLALACADDAGRGCAVRVTVLDEHGRAVGRARRTLAAGGYAQVTVPFTKAYTKRLTRARALPVTFVASMRDTRGGVRSDRYRYCAQAANVFVDTPVTCG